MDASNPEFYEIIAKKELEKSTLFLEHYDRTKDESYIKESDCAKIMASLYLKRAQSLRYECISLPVDLETS